MNKYIGHKSQVFGAEVHRLMGGKGDSMRLLEVWNGRGLNFTISLDRCADISRLFYKGVNIGYMSPVGYVHPSYYKKEEFSVLSQKEYVELIIDCLEYLPQNVVIHRLTGDGPRKLLLAPEWSIHKKQVLNQIQRRLKERDTYQGRLSEL